MRKWTAQWQPRSLAARQWLRSPMYILDDDMNYDLLLQSISMTISDPFSLPNVPALNDLKFNLLTCPRKSPGRRLSTPLQGIWLNLNSIVLKLRSYSYSLLIFVIPGRGNINPNTAPSIVNECMCELQKRETSLFRPPSYPTINK